MRDFANSHKQPNDVLSYYAKTTFTKKCFCNHVFVVKYPKGIPQVICESCGDLLVCRKCGSLV